MGRALGSRATAPPGVVRETLPAEPTVADALATSLTDALQRLLRNDPLARLGDAEGLHQLRVALRRLRSDLRTLEDHVDPAWRAGMHGRQATGATRLAARLADAQGALGTLQDVAVAEAAIRDTLDGHRPDADYAFEAGRIVERQRARASDARRAFFDISADLRRRHWRKWAS